MDLRINIGRVGTGEGSSESLVKSQPVNNTVNKEGKD